MTAIVPVSTLTLKVNNQAELARIHCITCARVTQIMNLLKLPSEIRTQIVRMPPDEQEYFSEKTQENCQAIVYLKTDRGFRRAEIQI